MFQKSPLQYLVRLVEICIDIFPDFVITLVIIFRDLLSNFDIKEKKIILIQQNIIAIFSPQFDTFNLKHTL